MKARLLAVLLGCISTGLCSAVINSQNTLTIDFTDPNDAKAKANWSEPNYINVTSQGLGWDGQENASRDFWLQTTELAIGLSWRPTQSANITIELEPLLKPIRPTDTFTPSPGSMFVRYSHDAKHWSSWQMMQFNGQKNSKYQYAVQVGVPRKDRARYEDYMRQYSKRDVPWKSDEEALVKWIVERDPNFLEKPMPFVGYVQFLYDASLYGGQRLTRLDVTASWGVGGKGAPPIDEPAFRKRFNLPWRFRADGVSDLVAERDRLLDQADTRIRSGLLELSHRFPQMKMAKAWQTTVSGASETGRISISLYHTDRGKAATAAKIPENERYSLFVVIEPPRAEPTQFAMFRLYPALGLVGQVGADAGDPDLAAVLKKLVDDALAPLKLLNEKAQGERPVPRPAE